MTSFATLFLLSLYLSLVNAYSFQFQNTPTQCGTVKIGITGSGTPPYRLSVIPSGGSPLSSGLEVRKVLDLPFNDSSSISFILPYPTNSQFVAVVSDNNGTGFGTGGATVPVNVDSSSDNSCVPTQQVTPDFIFQLSPDALTECSATTLSWNDTQTQGNVQVWGVIAGGDSFIINGNAKSGATFTPQIVPGVNVLVVVGDSRGFGSGGSAQQVIQPGNNDKSCISGNSPSSTPGSPAGGSYPTSTNGSGTGGSGSSGPNIGAIVGGVIGGIALIAICGIVLFVLLRRRRSRHRFDEQPVDLLGGRDQGQAGANAPVPQQYVPEPYHIPADQRPDMSETSEGNNLGPGALSGGSRRISGITSTESSGPLSGTSNTTKSGAPPSLRPVNIVQHEDAGPSEGHGQQEPETVELPPAYTNLRK